MPGMTGGSSAAPASGAMAEFSRAGARKVEEKLNSTMNSARVPALAFPGEVSLAEVLMALESSMSVQESIAARFVLDEADPDIGTDTEFLSTTTISDVSISEDSMTVASALDLILRKVKDQDPKLTWIVEKEVILITTEASAESEERVFIRSYDVKKLRPMFEEMAKAVPEYPVYPMGMGQGGGGGGFYVVPQESLDAVTGIPGTESSGSTPPGIAVSLKQLGGGGVGGEIPPEPTMIPNTWQRCLIIEIQSLTVPPCQWFLAGGEFGTMSVVGHRLIVQQTRSGHEAVVEVLESLEQGIEVP